jgi:hypothetical protein
MYDPEYDSEMENDRERRRRVRLEWLGDWSTLEQPPDEGEEIETLENEGGEL